MALIPFEDEEVTIESFFKRYVLSRDASPTHYLLKIESFSLLSESGIDKYESNEFESGGYKWKMIIYPNGNGSEHISVYLAISGSSSLPSGWEVNAMFTFFLFNQLCDNYLAVRGKVRRFHSIKSEWGLPKFLSHKAFKEPSNGYLVEDKCVFGAEIFVIKSQAMIECLSSLKYNDSFKREWKIPNFTSLGVDSEWLSGEFTVGLHRWKLWLFPKGDNEERGLSISIFLKSADSKDFVHHQNQVKASYSISIKDQINGSHEKNTACVWFSTSKRNWGFPSFMPLSRLHSQENGFIVNDCIVVEVEMDFLFTHKVV